MHLDPLSPWPAPEALASAMDRAVRAIPPAWPLASSVAVNPFLGQASEPLAKAGARLSRIAGARITLPRRWYAAKIATGEIRDDDLAEALAAASPGPRPADVAALKAAAGTEAPSPSPLPTVAELASGCSGMDWPGLVADRFGAWAASYFDQGQALWAAPKGKSAYAAWRSVAMHDLTPEFAGLPGFAQHVAEAPETALALVGRAVVRLGLSSGAAETYFHQLLTTLGGWAQYARYQLWQAELGGGTDDVVVDLLAIRLVWEEALYLRYESELAGAWADVCAAHAAPVQPTLDDAIDVILQTAAERSAQRVLAQTLAAPSRSARDARPTLQAAFCIDVRSEVVRRALESLDAGIQTLGFAGFFGLTTAHRRFASDVAEHRHPVLLKPALCSHSGGPEARGRDQSARFKARAKRAWGRFKLAAVSSFAFVEATGPLYAGKLLVDGLGLHHARPAKNPAPRFDVEHDQAQRVTIAETVLRAMSFTSNFARLVLLAGHGAHVVNNAHASALNCGACGGYSGEVNARLLASLLNEAEVRAGLKLRGIDIPDDTLFVAALHDTTADDVRLFGEDHPSPAHKGDLDQAKLWLAAAGEIARTERALRLPRAETANALRQRSRDWSETRPEWGLAGCQAFIAAPRGRTAGKSLQGRAFLHDYDWTKDDGFSVLELILTAPVVVASWICLQYYGSTVAPELFGGGNKLLHNVAGGVGVLEGNGGLLRTGLPWQSVHDGDVYVHNPLRLSVCIEAPRRAMSEILSRHEEVRALFDNGWLHLFALDEAGRMAWRYAGDLEWSIMDEDDAPPVSFPLRAAV